MSTGTRRPLDDAIGCCDRFRELFRGTYHEWHFAGSIRRAKPTVGDAEHVVIPKWETVPGLDLFQTPELVNAVWRAADKLLAAGRIQKHIYGTSGFRWGGKARGIEFGGMLHEIYLAEPDNGGSVLAIRTGPAEFSKRLVTGLLKNRLRNKGGSVWECKLCPDCDDVEAWRGPRECSRCDGTGLVPVCPISVVTERQFFSLAGVEWVEPEDR